MPRATRTASQAVTWGRGQHRDRGREWKALCLSFVRQAWGLPGVYGHANAARRGCRKFHPWTGNVNEIPYGAPVWSDKPGGSLYGHVFLAGGTTKAGQRIFWSNDISVSGGISPVTIDAFTNRWGHRILGWGEDLNGYDLNLPGVGKKDKPPKRIKHKKVPGWWVVDTNRLNGRARPSTGAKVTKKKRRGAKVRVDRAVHHEGRLWVRSDKNTWYAAGPAFKADYIKPVDRAPKRIKHRYVPGWWTVSTKVLNGRKRPSTDAKITKKKHRGAKVKVDRAVHHEGRMWVRSDRGTWFAAGPKFKADYIIPRGRRKK